MSDLTVFGEFDQYEINESYKSEKDARFIKWIKILVLILLGVLLAEVFIFKIVHPSLNEPKLVISGNSSYSNKELASPLNLTI